MDNLWVLVSLLLSVSACLVCGAIPAQPSVVCGAIPAQPSVARAEVTCLLLAAYGLRALC
eukprot:COSAG01_NODE_1600_length_9763_cov_7.146359_2_plen_60_part_00